MLRTIGAAVAAFAVAVLVAHALAPVHRVGPGPAPVETVVPYSVVP